MSLVQQAVQDRVPKGGIADEFVPVFDGKLACHQGGLPPVAVFNDLQQIPSFSIGHGCQSPVVNLCGAPHKSTNGKTAVM